jgi:hypothetical protein
MLFWTNLLQKVGPHSSDIRLRSDCVIRFVDGHKHLVKAPTINKIIPYYRIQSIEPSIILLVRQNRYHLPYQLIGLFYLWNRPQSGI